MSEIKCRVEECHYNQTDMCLASTIEVKSRVKTIWLVTLMILHVKLFFLKEKRSKTSKDTLAAVF